MDKLGQELQGHPNHVFVQSLVTGLREGFHIGYKGPKKSCVSWNLKSTQGNPEVVDKYLDKETLQGRVGGPFEPPPPSLTCNVTPLGSFPRKTQGIGTQLSTSPTLVGTQSTFNYKRMSTLLHYVTVDKAISIIKQFGPGAWLRKVDIEEAFRIIPVHPDDWHLLGMYWEGQYYHDKRLSMGSRSSPYIFDQLPIALE